MQFGRWEKQNQKLDFGDFIHSSLNIFGNKWSEIYYLLIDQPIITYKMLVHVQNQN